MIHLTVFEIRRQSICIKLSLTFRLQTQNSPCQITRIINKHYCKDKLIHSPQFHVC